jgi:hypothetical protein
MKPDDKRCAKKTPHHFAPPRRCAAIAFALALVFACLALAQPTSAAPLADRAREMERLIDAVASRNEAPKVDGKFPGWLLIFPAKFDWNDQKRVQDAAWRLSQDDSNDLWGCLMEHVGDKRYSGTSQEDSPYPGNVDVGYVCSVIAGGKLRCAHLLHLAPGKTDYYGVKSLNHVSENSREFLPDSVQRELHFSKHPLGPGGLAAWYRARKGKPFYELQVEVCEWAVKTVEDARGAAEEPKRQYIAAVKKQIESLKRSKKPVVDSSPCASPMSWECGWRFYSMESLLYERDSVLKEAGDREVYFKWMNSKERKETVERIEAQKAAEAEQHKKGR